MNDLYLIPVHVKPLAGSEMPAEAAGAYVMCFAAAESEEAAKTETLAALAEDDFEFLEMNGAIMEMQPEFWPEYVQETWPEEYEELPDQAEIQELLVSGGVLYGPFACYSSK